MNEGGRSSGRPQFALWETLEIGDSEQTPLLFSRAGGGEDAHDDVSISFVAGDLVNILLRLPEMDFRRPRFGPGCRVIDRYLIFDRVGRSAGEAFNHV